MIEAILLKRVFKRAVYRLLPIPEAGIMTDVSQARILVVDDEEPIVNTVSAIFNSAGYAAMGAYSGQDAITKAFGSCPSLLLCDVMMPDFNGFQVALEIKRLCPRCRILFFSGQLNRNSPLVEDFTHVFDRLGYQFELLPKPLHPSHLLHTVERLLSSPPA